MGTKTIYTCDNPTCGVSSDDPKGWFNSTEALKNAPVSLIVHKFKPMRAKEWLSFCGINCVSKFISTQLPLLSTYHNESKEQSIVEFCDSSGNSFREKS